MKLREGSSWKERRAFLAAGTLILAAVLSLTACSSGSNPTSTVAPTATAVSSAMVTPATAVPTATTAATNPTPTPQGLTPVSGGTIKWALVSSLPSLDPLMTTVNPLPAAYAGMERLFDFNSDLEAKPTLVSAWNESSDGLTWDFTLRDVALNGPSAEVGKPYTAAMAVSCFQRWLDRDNFGNILEGFITSMTSTGAKTFEIKLNAPTALLLDGMARIGGYQPFMMSPEMCSVPVKDAPGPGTMDTFGGTGPYQLTEWVPGDHITMKKWSGYKSPSGPSSYNAGAKHAYADTLEAIVIPEESSRISALKTGEIDFAGTISADNKATLQGDSNINLWVDNTAATRIGIWPNNASGPMSNVNVRKAVLMAIPKDQILLAATGDKSLERECGSLMICDTRWGGIRTPGDNIYYDPPNIPAAKQLVQQAGVAGDTVTLLSVQGTWEVAAAEIIQQTLVQLGLKVNFQSVDRATYSKLRSSTSTYDMFLTGGGVAWGGISPLLNSTISKETYWNEYQDPSGQMMKDMKAFARASTAQEQTQLVTDMQKVFYQDLPYIPIGETLPLYAQSAKLHGVNVGFAEPVNMVNAWKQP